MWNSDAEMMHSIKNSKSLKSINVTLFVLSSIRFDFAPRRSPYVNHNITSVSAVRSRWCSCLASCALSFSIMLCQQDSMCREKLDTQHWVLGPFRSSIRSFGHKNNTQIFTSAWTRGLLCCSVELCLGVILELYWMEQNLQRTAFIYCQCKPLQGDEGLGLVPACIGEGQGDPLNDFCTGWQSTTGLWIEAV